MNLAMILSEHCLSATTLHFMLIVQSIEEDESNGERRNSGHDVIPAVLVPLLVITILVAGMYTE